MRYTSQEKEWLKENFPNLGIRTTTRMFNEIFNHTQNEKAISRYCNNVLGVYVRPEVTHELRSRNHNHSCLNVTGRRFYEADEIQWLKENYSKLGARETCRQFNKLFDRDKNFKSLSTYCKRSLGLSISKEKWLELKSAPIGYKYKSVRGDWYIKTEQGWELLTHTIKKVPKGHIAFHLDGNFDNNAPENIAVIRNGIHTIARNCNVLSEDPTITSVGLTWSELYSELKKQKESKSWVEKIETQEAGVIHRFQN